MYNDIDRPAELARIASQTALSAARSVSVAVRHQRSLDDPPIPPKTQSQEAGLADPTRPTTTPSSAASGPTAGPVTDFQEASENPTSEGQVDLAASPQSCDESPPIEQLVFSIRGATTWVEATASGDRALHDDVSVETTQFECDESKGRVFQAILPPNPSFLYEYADTVEVLVCRPGAWKPTYRDSLVATYVLRQLACAAAEVASAPILFAQSPVAPAPAYAAGDGSKESHRSSHSASVRMSVAISKGRPAARMDFLSSVVKLADECGMSCHISDDKSERVRGDWFDVLPANKDRYLGFRDERFGSISLEPIETVVMTTIVGPARTGSTLTIASHLANEGIGIVAFSVSSMCETAVVNLTLAVRPDLDDQFVATASPSSSDAPRGLKRLRRMCSLDGFVGGKRNKGAAVPDGHFDTDDSRLSLYKTLQSEPFRVSIDRSQKSYPIWVAWDLPEDLGRIQMVDGIVRRALEKMVANVELSYGRTRITPLGHRRGRAKFSVTVHSRVRFSGITGELRRIAEHIEDVMRFELSEAAENETRFRFRALARERWLGRWRLPI